VYGPYSTFQKSPASKGILQFDMWNKEPEYFPLEQWEHIKQEIQTHGLRNSTLISLMPTASTAQIMGNNESFEPYTSNIYTRKVLSGEFIIINKHLVKYLRENNLYTKDNIDLLILQKGSVQELNLPIHIKDIFKTVWEISQKTLLEMSADRGPYICQSQSLNIFIENADPKILNSVHIYGHSIGLKTGSYYIRTKPTLSVQNFSIDFKPEKKNINIDNEPCLNCSS
jgi:ribonucleotide reductase alpha subunit